MTHDELLAKIKWCEVGVTTHHRVGLALRAVVEVLAKGFDFSDCQSCMRGFDNAKYKVIQAIEKELE